jgi:hypothetical protein
MIDDRVNRNIEDDDRHYFEKYSYGNGLKHHQIRIESRDGKNDKIQGVTTCYGSDSEHQKSHEHVKPVDGTPG